jgi:hypothetical protein
LINVTIGCPAVTTSLTDRTHVDDAINRCVDFCVVKPHVGLGLLRLGCRFHMFVGLQLAAASRPVPH